jgi:hypothetical protein
MLTLIFLVALGVAGVISGVLDAEPPQARTGAMAVLICEV